MTDVLTTAKSLTKQTIGGNDNTWGTILNATVEQIDKALGQTVTVAITGNTVLTASQAEYLAYSLTGTPGGNKTVTWPSYNGFLFVENSMTDGSAAICGTGGATVTVLAGDTALIFCDGADFIQPPRRRFLLTANATYVFSYATGNDATGNGSTAAPWRTLQHAHDWLVENIDGGGYRVTIAQGIGGGTDPTGLVVTQPILGAGAVEVSLASGILTVNPYGIYATGAEVNITISGTGQVRGATNDIVATDGATVQIGGITTGACSGGKLVGQLNSRIIIVASYGDSGNAASHWQLDTGSTLTFNAAATLTLSGTPVYSSAFAVMTTGGITDCRIATFSGSASGPRYAIDKGGGIWRGANDLPGTVAGTADPATFGWYV